MHQGWVTLGDPSQFPLTVKLGRQELSYGDERLVGSELDLIATYKVSTFGLLQAGYGHFFRGDYVEESLAARGSKDADWIYVQAVINF